MNEKDAKKQIAAVLLSMGGPSGSHDVEPFLTNLFSDEAILPLPGPARRLLARRIAHRRAPHALERYQLLGGSSPIHGYTAQQVRQLQGVLGDEWHVTHCFRYTEPFSGEVVRELVARGVRTAVLLSTYPQRSHTTIDSSVKHFLAAARPATLDCRTVTSHPVDPEFVGALARLTRRGLDEAGESAVVVMTAHGLPRRNVRRGDPYVAEVTATAQALGRALPPGVEWRLAFQSRLGPVRWVEPHLDETLTRMGAAGTQAVVVVPISFTSEHLETLIELDHEMREKASEAGIGTFVRVPVVGLTAEYIGMLARLARTEVRRG